MALAQIIAKTVAKQIVARREEENAAIEQSLQAFTDPQRRQFEQRFALHKKSLGVAYACCMLAGLHYAYLQRWVTQIIFLGTLGGAILWWLWDMGLMFFIVDAANRQIKRQLIEQIARMPRPAAARPPVQSAVATAPTHKTEKP